MQRSTRRMVFIVMLAVLLLNVTSTFAQPTKPTPTPLPPTSPLFNIPDEYSLWASTDYAVQSWNLLGDPRTIVQAIILIVLIAAGLVMLTKFIKELTRKDAED